MEGCCSSVPSDLTRSKTEIVFPTVMHTNTCTELTHKHIPMAGHTDQHRHILSTLRNTNGTNGLILFPSLSDTWCWVSSLARGAEALLQQPENSLGRDFVSLILLLGFSHQPLCPGAPSCVWRWADGSCGGHWSSQDRALFRFPHLLMSLCAPCMCTDTYHITQESSLAISLLNTNFSDIPERQH